MSTPSILRGGIGLCATIALAIVGDGCAPKTATDTSSIKPGALPCEVEEILSTVCQRCHSSPPKNDAPFPLVTYGDTQVIVNGKPITSYMLPALETGRMPMQPVQLPPADRETLIRWLRSGAPPRVEASCEANDGGTSVSDADVSADATDATDAIADAAPEATTEIDAGSDAAVDANDPDGGVE